jgi:hypothetical protein
MEILFKKNMTYIYIYIYYYYYIDIWLWIHFHLKKYQVGSTWTFQVGFKGSKATPRQGENEGVETSNPNLTSSGTRSEGISK